MFIVELHAIADFNGVAYHLVFRLAKRREVYGVVVRQCANLEEEGGLTRDQDTRVNSGLSFLPRWAAGHTVSATKTEILLLLQVQKI